jgi:LemA protein
LDLQTQLKDTEDKIGYSRQFYNDTAMKFNIAIVKVPTSIIAGLFGFKGRPYFKTEGEERENVEVKF